MSTNAEIALCICEENGHVFLIQFQTQTCDLFLNLLKLYGCPYPYVPLNVFIYISILIILLFICLK